jgi:predicted Zn-dependent protease
MSRPSRLLCIALWSAALTAQAPNPAEQARRAQELITAGKPAEAIPIYRDLIHAFPENPQLLLNISIAEYTAARYQDSIRDAEGALRIRPDMLQAHLFRGASYLAIGDYAAALDPLQRVIAADPGERNARVMLAEALLGAGRYREALASFQLASDAQHQNAKVWYGLGRVYDELARETAQLLEKAAPDSPYWFAVAGHVLVDQRRLGNAFAAFRKSLASGLALPGAYAGLAEVYTLTGHPDWAAEASRRAREENAVKVDNSKAAALYQEYLANRRQALEAYQHLDRLPSTEKALHTARTLDARGEYMEAARFWREALKLAPGNNEIRSGLARCLYRGRDYPEVLELLAELLKMQPDSLEANFLYGATLLNTQQAGTAIPYLEAALKSNPNFAPAHAALGQALLQTGEAENAIPHLKAGLETDEDGSMHFRLLRAYQLTRDSEQAKKAMVEYQSFRSALDERNSQSEGTAITAP